MKFCSECGAEVALRVPQGDNRERFVCTQCHVIHYHNPKVVVGCLAEWQDNLLFCRRAIEPRLGMWTLPAGFMENGESCETGARRETLEEAGARVEVVSLFSVFSLPHINQVYLLYRARLLDLDFAPGEESLEVVLIPEERVPWEQIAFPVIGESLRRYYQDKKRGRFQVHQGVMELISRQPRRFRVRYLNDQYAM